ncbi:sugar porter family MFS transporter [Agarivorans litoreus]|uniref:sugar porter family MFS transporter n=1 Tax=Agarivorans litoreus TaxID=1510455 RepID=UPI00280AE08E|nr:sugar porter family MFS transporter [Agarivorans litoreus]
MTFIRGTKMDIKTWNAYKYALIVAIGGFVFGLDAAIISGTVRFIASEFSLTDLQIGTVVGAPSLGAILALLVAGKTADALGRKKTLIIIAGLYVVSALLSALATSFMMLTIARFIGGLAFSSLSLASMYIGEIAPAKQRGKLVSANQFNIVIGLLAAYFINYYLVLHVSENSLLFAPDTVWRTMLASELIPAVLWVILLCRVPESPRWLMMKNKEEQAKEVLLKLLPEQRAEEVQVEIEQNLKEHQDTSSITEQLKLLFSSPMKTIFAIGFIMAVVQGITGMNAILFYAPTVFEQIGFGLNASFQQAIYIGITSVVFTVLAVFFIDKVGRKPLLIFGLLAVVLSHATCWYGFSNASYSINQQTIDKLEDVIDTTPLKAQLNSQYADDVSFKEMLASNYDADTLRLSEGHIIEAAISVNPIVILVGILAFIAAFHISIGPIMWVLFSEIFPNSIRSVAIPLFALVTSVASYLIQQFFPWQLANLGAANTFLMYSVFGLIGLLLLWPLLPETKNKTIEEIEDTLVNKRNQPTTSAEVSDNPLGSNAPSA